MKPAIEFDVDTILFSLITILLEKKYIYYKIVELLFDFRLVTNIYNKILTMCNPITSRGMKPKNKSIDL